MTDKTQEVRWKRMSIQLQIIALLNLVKSNLLVPIVSNLCVLIELHRSPTHKNTDDRPYHIAVTS
jgi:hypothetical protein